MLVCYVKLCDAMLCYASVLCSVEVLVDGNKCASITYVYSVQVLLGKCEGTSFPYVSVKVLVC